MRRSPTWWLAGIALIGSLAGCAHAPTEPPVSHAFREATTLDRQPVADPVPLPERPRAEEVVVDGTAYLAFPADQAGRLMEVIQVGATNTEIAGEHAAALRALQAERLATVQAGRAVEQRANLLARQWAGTRDQLQGERTEHALDTWIHRLLIVLLAGAAL